MSSRAAVGGALLILAIVLIAVVPGPTARAAGAVLGNDGIEPTLDPSSVGDVEATQYVASSSTTVDTLSIYLDASNAATSIALGIYDDAAGVPRTLVAHGSLASIRNGAWNSITIAPLALTAGRPYWIARLALAGGRVVTRGDMSATNPDRVDTRSNSALPQTFSPGQSWPHSASMYASTMASVPSGAGFVGEHDVERDLDPSGVGTVEATQFTAESGGPVSAISIFLDSSNESWSFELGIYADAGGAPGALLARGSGEARNGSWNTVAIPELTVTGGGRYWLARLATSGGTLVTRGDMSAANPDRTDTRDNATLPASFSPGGSFPHRVSIYATVIGPTATPSASATATSAPSATPTATSSAGGSGFVGNNVVEAALDPSGLGQAEATQYTASASGSVSTISIFIDGSNAATSIALGIYGDASGVPGTLLAQGSRTGVIANSWNSVSIVPIDITAGTPYWIARLAVAGGSVVTRGNNAAGNPDRVDTRTLSSLPQTFSPGASFPHRASMYAGTAAGGTPPPTPSPTTAPTPTPTAGPTATPGGGACMEIIGFSQTMQWYFGGSGNEFRAQMSPGATQLRWAGGAAIDSWADPGFWPGLSNACSSGSAAPDRVVLNISGGHNSDVGWWRDQTRQAVANVRRHHPGLQTVYLQPVVGGPGHGACFINGVQVRATFNEPFIAQAIDQLVAEGVGAWGANPLAHSCADFADDIGHLTDAAKGAIAFDVGVFYQTR
jgi:hypothetical protein